MISALQAFPWPAGKAPWLVENGGTGIVPNGALERFGKSRDFRQISMEENSESAGAYHALPAVENVPAPRNIQAHNTYMYLCGQIYDSSLQEAQQMLALAESLADSAMERFGQQRSRKALMLKAVKAVLVLKLGNEAGSFVSSKKACGQGA